MMENEMAGFGYKKALSVAAPRAERKTLIAQSKKGINMKYYNEGMLNAQVEEKNELETAKKIIRNMEVRFVTPEMAKRMLGRLSPNQRKLDISCVNTYTYMMKNGQWRPDVIDALIFDEDGYLCNGQHRLHAVIKSETGQVFYIQRKADSEMFWAVDNGKNRRGSDFIEGPGARNKEALMKVIISLEKNAPLRTALSGRYVGYDGRLQTPVKYEIKEKANHSPDRADHDEIILINGRMQKMIKFSKIAALAAVYWIAKTEGKKEKCIRFLNELVDERSSNPQILRLRQDLMCYHEERKKNDSQERQIIVGAIMLRFERWEQNDDRVEKTTKTRALRSFEKCEKTINMVRTLKMKND